MSKEGETRNDIFDALVTYKITHQGNTPSVRQIMAWSGIKSTHTVAYHLEHLADSGRIIIHRISRNRQEIEIPGYEWRVKEQVRQTRGLEMWLKEQIRVREEWIDYLNETNQDDKIIPCGAERQAFIDVLARCGS